MSEQLQDEWSAPSLHTSASFQPPIDHGSPMDAMWSTPVYIGRRGKACHRPANAGPGRTSHTGEPVAAGEHPAEGRDSSRQVLANSRTIAIAHN